VKKLKRKSRTLTDSIGYILNRVAVHSFGYGAILIDDDGNIIDDLLDEDADCNKDIGPEEKSEQSFETL